jgi:hypothetical protein
MYLCVLYRSENKQRCFLIQHCLTGFYNRNGMCLLRGTNTIVIHNWLVMRRVIKIEKSDYQLRHDCPPARPSVRPSVRPSDRMELGFLWKDFHDIWCLNIIRKSAEKIKVSWKFYKNDRRFTWRSTHVHYLSLSRSVLLRMENLADERCRESRNTHSICNHFFHKSWGLWYIYLLTYITTYLLTYIITYLLHAAESFLRS